MVWRGFRGKDEWMEGCLREREALGSDKAGMGVVVRD